MKKSILLFVIFLSLQQPWADTTLQQIDQYLETILKQGMVPGFSVVMVHNQSIVYSKGFGAAVYGQKTPMTENTSSSIGSLTKSFTAVCILQLEEKGLLSIDDPVVKYLSWFRTADSTAGSKITLRMLLSNSSGIPSVDYLIMDSDNSANADEYVVRSLSAQPLSFQPGAAFEYSNEGWVILGLIIKQITGMLYAEYLEKNVLAPLEMTRSTSNAEKFRKLGAISGHYAGVDAPLPADRINLSQAYAAAGSILTCSANDLGHYLVMLLNRGTYKGKSILSAASVKKLHTGVITYPGLRYEDGGDDTDEQYCLGWSLSLIDGRQIIHHNGNTGTMSSFTMIEPGRGTAVSILLNIGSTDPYAGVNMLNTANNLLHIYAGEKQTAFAIPRKADPFANTFVLAEGAMPLYQGTFINQANSTDIVHIFTDSAHRLILENSVNDIIRLTGWIDFLTPASAVIRSIGFSLRMTFMIDTAGQVTGCITAGGTYRLQENTKAAGIAYFAGKAPKAAFLIGREWTVTNQDSGEYTLFKNNGSTLLIKITGGKADAEDTFRDIAEENIEFRGMEHHENIGAYAWIDQSYVTQAHQGSVYYADDGMYRIYIVLITPVGDLTRITRDYLLPLLQSVRLQEK